MSRTTHPPQPKINGIPILEYLTIYAEQFSTTFKYAHQLHTSKNPLPLIQQQLSISVNQINHLSVTLQQALDHFYQVNNNSTNQNNNQTNNNQTNDSQ